MTNEANFSRREFFKKALAMTAVAFLAELRIPSTVRAQIEKLLASQEFIEETLNEMLMRLKEESYQNREEVVWAHINRGDKTGSLHIQKSTAENQVQLIDLAPLYKDPAVTSIALVHTHTAEFYETEKLLPEQTIKAIRRHKKSDYPIMPTATDFFGAIIEKSKLRGQGANQHIKEYVVEPSGVWTYEVDLDHPWASQFEMRGNRMPPPEDMIRFIDIVGSELEIWQDRFWKEGSVTSQTLAALQDKAKKEWGIIIKFRKWQE